MQKILTVLTKRLENRYDRVYYYTIDEAGKMKDSKLNPLLSKLDVKFIPSTIHIKNGKSVIVLTCFKVDKELRRFLFYEV